MNTLIPPAGIGCSLNDEEFRERLAIVRTSIRPHITNSERLFGLRLTFPDTAGLRTSLQSFAELERQCCSFLSLEVTSAGNELVLTISGPAAAQPGLEDLMAWLTGEVA